MGKIRGKYAEVIGDPVWFSSLMTFFLKIILHLFGFDLFIVLRPRLIHQVADLLVKRGTKSLRWSYSLILVIYLSALLLFFHSQLKDLFSFSSCNFCHSDLQRGASTNLVILVVDPFFVWRSRLRNQVAGLQAKRVTRCLKCSTLFFFSFFFLAVVLSSSVLLVSSRSV